MSNYGSPIWPDNYTSNDLDREPIRPASPTASAIDVLKLLVQAGYNPDLPHPDCYYHFSYTKLAELIPHLIAPASDAVADDAKAMVGAELGRWCYENPNLAARTIEGLRAAAATAWEPDAQTQQHLGQGHVNRGHGDKPGEKSDYSPDLEIGK